MVKAEKCPNCGAYLPVRQAGVPVRRCEFCDLELGGDTATIDVPALTTPATWLPGRRIADARPPRPAPPPPGSRLGLAIAIAIGLAGAIGIAVAVGTFASRAGSSGTADPLAASASRARRSPSADQARREAYAEALRTAAGAAGGWADLDLGAMLAFARPAAADRLPGADLVRIYAPNVKPDGCADLTLGARSVAYFQFRSPAASQPPPGTPRGASAVRIVCALQVTFGPEHAYEPSSHPDSPAQCRTPLLQPPRCTLAQIWQRAIAKGAPADAVATVHLAGDLGGRRDDDADPDVPVPGTWMFSIADDGGRGSRGFHARFADDCGTGAANAPNSASAPPGSAPPAPAGPRESTRRALLRRAPALHACLERAAAAHAAIEAVDATLVLELDARGRVVLVEVQPKMDVEGLFVGDMGAVHASFATCAAARLRGLVMPDDRGRLEYRVRVERAGGKLSFTPSP